MIMVNNNFKRVALLSLSLLMTAFVISCGSDDDDAGPTGDPVASFGITVDSEDYATINFINSSQNATSYEWNFGDGSPVNTSENPTHTFAEDGVYRVVLAASNGLSTDTVSQEISIEDPARLQELLSGATSKTWSLVREGENAAMFKAGDGFWPGTTNNGQRPCLYDDTFTFSADGTYEVSNGGTWWAEFGVHNNINFFVECEKTNTIDESCFEVTEGFNLVNECGDDISAWLGDTPYEYTFNSETGKITLLGTGAWIGVPKLSTTGEEVAPVDNVQFSAVLVSGGESGVDSMFIEFDHGASQWLATYVSYPDLSQAPEIVTEFVPPPCENLPVIAPTTISHTFASDEGAVLLDTVPSGNTYEYVADPAGGGGTVAKLTRVAGNQFQEMKFKFADTDGFKSIDFTNLNTLTIEVFIPDSSTNVYTGSLTPTVAIGFGNEKCLPEWFNDQHEWGGGTLPLGEWATVTIDLSTAADFVNKPDNGATLKDRNDMDLFYINFGSCCHFDGGVFYIRNLVMN